MNKLQKIVAVCVSLFMLGLFGIAVNRATNHLAIKPLMPGDKLPYLDLANVRAPAFQKKVPRTLFVFVRKDCTHCEALLRTLTQIADGQSASLPAINVIVVGPKEHARQVASQLKGFNIYADPAEKNFEACHGNAVPLQLLTDQNDVLLATHKGEMDIEPERLFLNDVKEQQP